MLHGCVKDAVDLVTTFGVDEERWPEDLEQGTGKGRALVEHLVGGFMRLGARSWTLRSVFVLATKSNQEGRCFQEALLMALARRDSRFSPEGPSPTAPFFSPRKGRTDLLPVLANAGIKPWFDEGREAIRGLMAELGTRGVDLAGLGFFPFGLTKEHHSALGASGDLGALEYPLVRGSFGQRADYDVLRHSLRGVTAGVSVTVFVSDWNEAADSAPVGGRTVRKCVLAITEDAFRAGRSGPGFGAGRRKA